MTFQISDRVTITEPDALQAAPPITGTIVGLSPEQTAVLVNLDAQFHEYTESKRFYITTIVVHSGNIKLLK